MSLISYCYDVPAAILGACVLARWYYRLVVNAAFFVRKSGIRRYLQPKPGDNSKDNEPWALITGSGSGLGRALAFELASYGFNIILHGSNVARLQAVQADLQATHASCSIRTLILDARICVLLNKTELAAKLDEVVQSLKDINLRILINNVAAPQAPPSPGPMFDRIETFTYDELLHNASLNAIFPLLFTRALYPLLIDNQPSLIINMGSMASMGPPLFPSYGPAKAFHMASAEELRAENKLEGRDIEVLGIDILSFTGSDTIRIEPTFLVPDAMVFAKSVVRCVGCGYGRVAPYLPHAVFFWGLGVLPGRVREEVLIYMMRGMRKEALGKLDGVVKKRL